MLLQPIKHAINGAEFEFRGNVSSIIRSGRLSGFTDNSMLLAHLEEELLPICNACRSYMFDIGCLRVTDTSAVTNTITTILQFGPIYGCSKVLFYLRSIFAVFSPTEIPVMSIANWLNCGPNSDTINTNEQVKNERILKIVSRANISNLFALVNFLKKVNLNYSCHKKLENFLFLLCPNLFV